MHERLENGSHESGLPSRLKSELARFKIAIFGSNRIRLGEHEKQLEVLAEVAFT